MTMTRKTLLAATFALPLLAAPVQATDLIEVVIDHSGVLHDEQDPQGKTGFNRFATEFLTELARVHRRERNNTRIIVISAVEPVRILWSGSAGDFYRHGLRGPVLQTVMTGQPNGCNNLPDAFAEARVNAQIAAADETSVYVVTSGVHSGPDCAGLGQEDYVRLVETADETVINGLKGLAGEVDRLSVFFLTATQRRGFLGKANWRELGVSLGAQGEGVEF